jgi:supervillin
MSVFFSDFPGRMAIHNGKRVECETDQTDQRWRLYIVRGEKEEEAHLLQVRRCVQALRSRGSLVLINQSTGTIFLWHGAKSLKHTRQVATFAASALKEHRPPELNVRVSFYFLFLSHPYKQTNKQSVMSGKVHHPSSSLFVLLD